MRMLRFILISLVTLMLLPEAVAREIFTKDQVWKIATRLGGLNETYYNIDYAIKAVRQITDFEPGMERRIYLLALAIAKVESNFKPEVVSSTGAIGLFQIKPTTALEISRKYKLGYEQVYIQLKDPQINSLLAIMLLYDYIKDTGSFDDAIMMYNQGRGVKYPGRFRDTEKHQAWIRRANRYKKKVYEELSKVQNLVGK